MNQFSQYWTRNTELNVSVLKSVIFVNLNMAISNSLNANCGIKCSSKTFQCIVVERQFH